MEEFNFEKDYTLENDNVILRPLTVNDLNNLIHFSADEPEIWKYNPIQTDINDLNFFHTYIANAINARNGKKEYPFIVFDKQQNKYAGSTRLYDIQLVHKRLRIGYTWYGKDFQGTGINKDCKFLLLQFAFEFMQMQRVGFRANKTNEKSLAAMKSIGCVIEGVLRSFSENLEGIREDAVILSILKSEWTNKVKNELGNKLRT